MSLVIRLVPTNGASLPANHGHVLHGWFMRWVGDWEPALAERLHDPSRPQLFSLAGLWMAPSRPDRFTPAPRWLAVASTIDPELGDFLTRRAAEFGQRTARPSRTGVRREEIELEKARFAIEVLSTDQSLEPHAARTTVDRLRSRLLELTDVPEELSLDFVTPAVLTSDGAQTFFPEAAHVFGSVHRRWRDAGLPPLWDEPDAAKLARVVARPDGLTTAVVLARGVQRHGVMGRCDYDLTALDEPTRRSVQLLAEVAYFTGVGKAVGHGMGRVMTAGRRGGQGVA